MKLFFVLLLVLFPSCINAKLTDLEKRVVDDLHLYHNDYKKNSRQELIKDLSVFYYDSKGEERAEEALKVMLGMYGVKHIKKEDRTERQKAQYHQKYRWAFDFMIFHNFENGLSLQDIFKTYQRAIDSISKDKKDWNHISWFIFWNLVINHDLGFYKKSDNLPFQLQYEFVRNKENLKGLSEKTQNQFLHIMKDKLDSLENTNLKEVKFKDYIKELKKEHDYNEILDHQRKHYWHKPTKMSQKVDGLPSSYGGSTLPTLIFNEDRIEHDEKQILTNPVRLTLENPTVYDVPGDSQSCMYNSYWGSVTGFQDWNARGRERCRNIVTDLSTEILENPLTRFWLVSNMDRMIKLDGAEEVGLREIKKFPALKDIRKEFNEGKKGIIDYALEEGTKHYSRDNKINGDPRLVHIIKEIIHMPTKIKQYKIKDGKEKEFGKKIKSLANELRTIDKAINSGAEKDRIEKIMYFYRKCIEALKLVEGINDKGEKAIKSYLEQLEEINERANATKLEGPLKNIFYASGIPTKDDDSEDGEYSFKEQGKFAKQFLVEYVRDSAIPNEAQEGIEKVMAWAAQVDVVDITRNDQVGEHYADEAHSDRINIEKTFHTGPDSIPLTKKLADSMGERQKKKRFWYLLNRHGGHFNWLEPKDITAEILEPIPTE